VAGLAGFEPTIKESKSFALPLGYSPISGGGGQIRTAELGESGFTVHRV
jgi:hypothetical protein